MSRPAATAWSRLRRSPSAMISLGVVLLYVFAAVGTEVYAAWCESNHVIPVYQQPDDTARYAPPSPEHWLGTDYQGRDVLLRAIAGSATAVKVGVIASLIAAVIGSETLSRVCVVPPWLLLAAVLFSVGIGLGSGYYPANKAVQISALEAIKTS